MIETQLEFKLYNCLYRQLELQVSKQLFGILKMSGLRRQLKDQLELQLYMQLRGKLKND